MSSTAAGPQALDGVVQLTERFEARNQGSAALLCTTAHPLCTVFTIIFGAKLFGTSLSEAGVRPDPGELPRDDGARPRPRAARRPARHRRRPAARARAWRRRRRCDTPHVFFVGRITHETYRGSAVLTRTDPTGVAARLLEHRAVGLVTLVEIDPAVIAACRRFFDCPGPPGAFRWPQRCLRVP